MKKIVALMLLLLSPFCAQAMDAESAQEVRPDFIADEIKQMPKFLPAQPAAAPKTAAKLSDSMEEIKGFYNGCYLETLLKKEAELNPNNQAASALLKELDNSSGTGKVLSRDDSFWLRAQKVVSNQAKRTTFSIIAGHHVP